MAKQMKWYEAGRARRPEEAAAPKDKSRVTPSDVARMRALSGPVRQWADMAPEEREKLLATLRRPA